MEPSEERLRQHNRVVSEALRTATPLPLRFGSVFRSTKLLEDAIDARHDSFDFSLRRVAGFAEMVVRVERKKDASPDFRSGPPVQVGTGRSAPGREYLEGRRARLQAREKAQQEAERLLHDLEQEIDDLAVERAVTIAGEGELVGRVACLVRRGDVAAFRQRIAGGLQASRPEMAFHVSGPWAPYSFANE